MSISYCQASSSLVTFLLLTNERRKFKREWTSFYFLSYRSSEFCQEDSRLSHIIRSDQLIGPTKLGTCQLKECIHLWNADTNLSILIFFLKSIARGKISSYCKWSSPLSHVISREVLSLSLKSNQIIAGYFNLFSWHSFIVNGNFTSWVENVFRFFKNPLLIMHLNLLIFHVANVYESKWAHCVELASFSSVFPPFYLLHRYDFPFTCGKIDMCYIINM